MKYAFDTNVLVYAEGVDDPQRQARAYELTTRIARDAGVIPTQVLGELFYVLVCKGGRSKAQARDALLTWHNSFSIIGTLPGTLLLAADLAADHDLRIWDSVVIATSAAAGCSVLFSEDLQDGFSWGGLTIVNPFAAQPSPIVAAILGSAL